MKIRYTVALAMFAGFGLGAIAVQEFMLRLSRLSTQSLKSISRIRQHIQPTSRRLRLRSRLRG